MKNIEELCQYTSKRNDIKGEENGNQRESKGLRKEGKNKERKSTEENKRKIKTIVEKGNEEERNER